MKLRTIIIFVVVAGASIASVAAYSHRHSTPEEHANHVVERLTNKLELSSSQQHQLQQLKDKVLEARSASGQNDKYANIQNLFADSGFDRGKAYELLNQHTQLVQQQGPDIINAAGDFYDGLSAEQRTELRSHLDHRKHHCSR